MIWMLAGCGAEPVAHHQPEPYVPPRWELLPSAPDDPIIGWLDDEPVQPVVHDDRGRDVPVTSGSRGWVHEGGFAPGSYAVVDLVGHELREPASFEVLPYGLTAVDGAGLVGRTWAVTAASDLDGVAGLAVDLFQPRLRVDAIDGDELEFRILAVDDQDRPCVALRDRGTWDGSTATLSWSVDHSTIEVPGSAEDQTGEVDAWDTAFEVRWLGDDARAWGSGRTTLDTLAIDDLVGEDPGYVCQMAGAWSQTECGGCPGGGRGDCVSDEVFSISLAEEPGFAVGDLPACGIDRISLGAPGPLEPISCDLGPSDSHLSFDCGCHTMGAQASAPLLLVGLAVLRRRRIDRVRNP